jgi:hypothetical protein
MPPMEESWSRAIAIAERAGDDILSGLLEGLAESTPGDLRAALGIEIVDDAPLRARASNVEDLCRRLLGLVDWTLHVAAPLACGERNALGTALAALPPVEDTLSLLAVRICVIELRRPLTPNDGAIAEMFENLDSALESAVWADAAAAHDVGRAHPLASLAGRAATGHAFSSASDEGHLGAAAAWIGQTIGHAVDASRFAPRLRDALTPLIESVILQPTPTLIATLRTLARRRVRHRRQQRSTGSGSLPAWPPTTSSSTPITGPSRSSSIRGTRRGRSRTSSDTSTPGTTTGPSSTG